MSTSFRKNIGFKTVCGSLDVRSTHTLCYYIRVCCLVGKKSCTVNEDFAGQSTEMRLSWKTGAMSAITGAALNVLLNMLSLDIRIQKDATKSATGLKINGVWLAGNTTGLRTIFNTLAKQYKLFS